MNESLTLLLAGTVGGILGTIFFGGLWWTVRQGLSSARPALWFLGSLLARTSIVLAGFYLIGHQDWKRALAAFTGFILARLTVIYLTGPVLENQLPATMEGSHAP